MTSPDGSVAKRVTLSRDFAPGGQLHARHDGAELTARVKAGLAKRLLGTMLTREFLCASNPQNAWDEDSSHKGQGRDRQYVSDQQLQEIARGSEGENTKPLDLARDPR
jgi:hypothetical protein